MSSSFPSALKQMAQSDILCKIYIYLNTSAMKRNNEANAFCSASVCLKIEFNPCINGAAVDFHICAADQ